MVDLKLGAFRLLGASLTALSAALTTVPTFSQAQETTAKAAANCDVRPHMDTTVVLPVKPSDTTYSETIFYRPGQSSFDGLMSLAISQSGSTRFSYVESNYGITITGHATVGQRPDKSYATIINDARLDIHPTLALNAESLKSFVSGKDRISKNYSAAGLQSLLQDPLQQPNTGADAIANNIMMRVQANVLPLVYRSVVTKTGQMQVYVEDALRKDPNANIALTRISDPLTRVSYQNSLFNGVLVRTEVRDRTIDIETTMGRIAHLESGNSGFGVEIPSFVNPIAQTTLYYENIRAVLGSNGRGQAIDDVNGNHTWSRAQDPKLKFDAATIGVHGRDAALRARLDGTFSWGAPNESTLLVMLQNSKPNEPVKATSAPTQCMRPATAAAASAPKP